MILKYNGVLQRKRQTILFISIFCAFHMFFLIFMQIKGRSGIFHLQVPMSTTEAIVNKPGLCLVSCKKLSASCRMRCVCLTPHRKATLDLWYLAKATSNVCKSSMTKYSRPQLDRAKDKADI